MIPMDNFAKQISRYKNILIVCGAGISTASGIPDFRSDKAGIYNLKTVNPQLLNVKTFNNKNTKFWKNFVKFAELASNKQPNPAHYAIAEISKLPNIYAIIEQNTDGLLLQAGAEKVIEAHGNLRDCFCTKCGKKYELNDILIQAKQSENIKDQIKCETLTCRGLIKPDVVLFGGGLSEKFCQIYKMAQMEYFDYVIFIGTSMTVFPIAEFADIIKKFAIFNRESTPYLIKADFFNNDPIEISLPELCRNFK